MKTNILTTLLVISIAFSSAMSQTRALKNFHDDFKGIEGVHFITLNGGLIKAATWIAAATDESDEDIIIARRMAKDIKRVQIMDIRDWNELLGKSDYARFQSDLLLENYEVMMTAREDGSDVKVLSRLSNGETSLKDVIILVEEGNHLAVISIEGELDMQLIADMISEGYIDIY